MSQKQKESLENIYAFVVGAAILAFIWIAIDTFAPKEMPSYSYYSGEGYVSAELRSILSIVAASLCAFISIYFSKKLKIVSNGLLIGSFLVFLMAMVSGLSSEESGFRFIIITISLGAILTVGYFKFTKNSEEEEQQVSSAPQVQNNQSAPQQNIEGQTDNQNNNNQQS